MVAGLGFQDTGATLEGAPIVFTNVLLIGVLASFLKKGRGA